MAKTKKVKTGVSKRFPPMVYSAGWNYDGVGQCLVGQDTILRVFTSLSEEDQLSSKDISIAVYELKEIKTLKRELNLV